MNTHVLSRSAILAASAALLVSCGGGGSSATIKILTQTPQGIFTGNSAGGNDVTMLVESNNDYWILYVSPAVPTGIIFIESGHATVLAPAFTTTADTEYDLLYTDPHAGNAIIPSGATTGTVFTDYTVDFDFNAQQQISGSILSGSNCVSTPTGCTVISVITPTYVAGSSGTTPSLSTVAGNYADNFSSTLNTNTLQASGCFFATALNVGSNGKITGTLTPCTGSTPIIVTGTLTPRTDIDAYDVTLSFANTGGDTQPLMGLSFSGIAYYFAAGKRLEIAALTADGSTGIGLVAGGPN